jgi:hypothetical protein
MHGDAGRPRTSPSGCPVPNAATMRTTWRHVDSPLLLGRATERDLDAITGLIDEAAEWLRTRNTDQWAQPWPSEEERSHRILKDLRAGKTWIARDESGSPAATITADPEDSPIWPRETLRDRAVYVCRLVVSRSHGGQGLGGAPGLGRAQRQAALRSPLGQSRCMDD